MSGDNDSEIGDEWEGRRTWSLDEATSALPLVRRIVDDLVIGYRRWREAVEAFEYATSGTTVDSPSDEADELMRVAQTLAAEIDGFQVELGRLDIRVMRVDQGLIGFRSTQGGAITPLLWAPGCPSPSYGAADAGDAATAYGTSISWPSRAQVVAGKRSRA